MFRTKRKQAEDSMLASIVEKDCKTGKLAENKGNGNRFK